MAKAGVKKPSIPGTRTSVLHHVQVAVGPDGSFTYTDTTNRKEASRLQACIGDTISWSATLNKIPVALQVEFPGFSPLANGIQVVRSASGAATTPVTVALPPFYNGNLAFKYAVTIANGWSDDPIVEPVPSDGIFAKTDRLITLSEDNKGALVLTELNASFSTGRVSWEWDPQSTPDDFTLTFDDPPNGWPESVTSQGRTIVLNLQAQGSSDYTIRTLHLGIYNDQGVLDIN